MKKTFNLLMIVAVCAIVLQSCKSKPSDKEVQGVANDFLKALINEDYAKAKELGTDDTDNMVEMTKMGASMMPDSLKAEMETLKQEAKKATLTMGAVTFNEEGTEATVKFTSSQAPGREESLKMKKVDKKWLADMAGDMPAN